jgi:hypothetical protein
MYIHTHTHTYVYIYNIYNINIHIHIYTYTYTYTYRYITRYIYSAPHTAIAAAASGVSSRALPPQFSHALSAYHYSCEFTHKALLRHARA